MNDSGELQEVESIFSGKFSHVPSQPAVVPSPRSLLSCDKRLPLDTWNTSGPQENVFGSQCSTIDSPRNHYGKIHDSTTPGATASVPVHIGTRLLSQEMKIELMTQFQCRHLQEGRRRQ